MSLLIICSFFSLALFCNSNSCCSALLLKGVFPYLNMYFTIFSNGSLYALTSLPKHWALQKHIYGEPKKTYIEHKKTYRKHKKINREHKKTYREHKKICRDHKKTYREHQKTYRESKDLKRYTENLYVYVLMQLSTHQIS